MDASRFRRHLFAALAVALIVRVVALAFPVDPFLNPDSLAFRDLARSLIERGRLAYVDQGAPGVELVAFRSLLYPVFLALFVALGLGVTGALVAQAALGLVTIAAIALAARRAFGPGIGAGTAWIGALYWSTVYFERQVTSEALFAPLLALAVWLSTRARGAPGAAVAGATFGLSALTRPAGLVAGASVALLWGIREVLARRADSKRARSTLPGAIAAAWLMLAMGLVLAPSLARNAALLGRPVLLTSGGMNFWIGNGRGEVGDAWRIMGERAPVLGERGMDEWFYADTWSHGTEIARQSPRLLADKILVFVGPFARDGWTLPYRFLWPLVALGRLWVQPRRDGDPAAAGVIAVVLASQVLLALATVPWGRYRLPIEPLLWPYAAVSIGGLLRWGVRGRLALVGIVLMNGALLAWQMR